MSEVEKALRDLRDELHATLPVPDVDLVADRVRVRRRLQAAVIAAVVVVAVAVPVLRALPDVALPAAPPPPRPALDIDFADARHGYALTGSCTRREPGCTFTLYSTEDGGRTWTPHRLPPPAVATSGYFSANMYVAGPDHVVLDQPDNRRLHRIQSTDGGRTWRQVRDPFRDDKLSEPPLPGFLTGLCWARPAPDQPCPTLGTIQADGRTVVLSGVPQLEHNQVGTLPTSGGRYWLVGRGPETGPWTVAVSADQGRSWSTTEVDLAGAIPAVGGWAVVERNGVMYATATGAGGLVGVWRSTDDGQSWVRTWAREGKSNRVAGWPIATEDGSLIITDGRTTHESVDLGHTFTPSDEPVTGQVRWTRAGYLRVNGGQYALSTDGRHWRSFVVG